MNHPWSDVPHAGGVHDAPSESFIGHCDDISSGASCLIWISASVQWHCHVKHHPQLSRISSWTNYFQFSNSKSKIQRFYLTWLYLTNIIQVVTSLDPELGFPPRPPRSNWWCGEFVTKQWSLGVALGRDWRCCTYPTGRELISLSMIISFTSYSWYQILIGDRDQYKVLYYLYLDIWYRSWLWCGRYDTWAEHVFSSMTPRILAYSPWYYMTCRTSLYVDPGSFRWFERTPGNHFDSYTIRSIRAGPQ